MYPVLDFLLMHAYERNRENEEYNPLISWFPMGLIPEGVQDVHEGEKQK